MQRGCLASHRRRTGSKAAMRWTMPDRPIAQIEARGVGPIEKPFGEAIAYFGQQRREGTLVITAIVIYNVT
jgi:hypothetical protein